MITLPTVACDLGSEPSRRRRADEASIEVTGESPVLLVLVTSKDWGMTLDEETGEQKLVITKADTVEIDLPYQRTVPLAPTYRILFRLINPDADRDATVRMRVSLDDDVVYDQQATLRNAALQYSHAYY
ncbi:MAG TPA: hypothetical protein VIL18_10705 [Longimicrobiales bacterium]